MNNKNDAEKVRQIRENMPAALGCYFLNTGTNGIIPKVSADIMKEEIENEYTKGRYLPFLENLYAHMDSTRELIAKITGSELEEIALTQSTTEGMNIVLWGMQWNPGDEVITTTVEHPGGLAPLSLVKARYGLVVKYVDVQYGNDYDDHNFLSQVEELITPKTRLLMISHVSFSTGINFPLKKLVDLCHSHNIYVLVDGAQGVGAVSVNFHDLGVDFYAIAGRKWLCGPEGIGALFVAKKRISELNPTFISPASIRNRHELDINSPYVMPAPFAARYQIATSMNRPILLGFEKALEYLYHEIGIEWITDRIARLAKYARELMSDIPNINIITPPGKEGGFIHFAIKGWEPSDLCNKLNEKSFMIRPVPKQHLPAPARISTGFYNTEEELELFTDTLKKIVT